jgi:hypothetical protein
MNVTIVKVLDTKVDKNGTQCRVGITEESFDSKTDTHYKEKVVYTSLESAFARWDEINNGKPLRVEV